MNRLPHETISLAVSVNSGPSSSAHSMEWRPRPQLYGSPIIQASILQAPYYIAITISDRDLEGLSINVMWTFLRPKAVLMLFDWRNLRLGVPEAF